MPRRLTSIGRRKARTISDFAIADQLCFIAAWRPPDEEWDDMKSQIPDVEDSINREDWIAAAQGRTRWATWEEFLSDYEAVREELLNTQRLRDPNGPIFAEQVWQERRGTQ